LTQLNIDDKTIPLNDIVEAMRKTSITESLRNLNLYSSNMTLDDAK